MDAILVLTHYPNKQDAIALSHALIEQRLAACVNILSPCTSTYRWQDEIESAEEFPVTIKTRLHHYAQVEQLIKMMHPYELPEVIMIPIAGGLPAYLQWIVTETSSSN